MAKSPEELKAALIERAEARKVEETPDPEAFMEMAEADEEELGEMLEAMQDQNALMVVEEEGFNGYVVGLEVEQNPYEEEADSEMLAEAWVDGWYSAHVQACVANILLSAKALVEAKDPEQAEQHLDNLTEAVQVAEEAIDFDETQDFWDALMEGAEDDENQRG